MKVSKIIGLILIIAGVVLMLHSLMSLYLMQCLRSSVPVPSFFTQGMVEFFQLDISTWGKCLRMALILILPSLGIELCKDKKDRVLRGSLILRVAGLLLLLAIIIYILFYPSFE